jgi:MerR HTH family regulatory protein
MPLSSTRDYMSIGEVLEAVKADFPDVSISKIRFLETEGLITPERTSSGYRKFYETDVNRLRHILSMQRDQFLPLRVIRERLKGGGGVGDGEPAVASSAGALPRTKPSNRRRRSNGRFTRKELLDETGISETELESLEEFGLLSRSKDGYDAHEADTVRAAAGLFRHGLEARHLRVYKSWADREAALLEQVVVPLITRKDQRSHEEAIETLDELLDHSGDLRSALLASLLHSSVS